MGPDPRQSIDGEQLSIELGIGEQRNASQTIIDVQNDEAIAQAVEKLTNLGMAGAIEFWAQKFRNVFDNGDEIFTEPIRPVRLADYRWFDSLDDCLYRGSGLSWDHNRRQPRYPRDERHFRFVAVNRDQLLREFPLQENSPLVPAGSVVVEEDKKRLVPLSNSQFDRWWENLGNVRDVMSATALLKNVRECFPENFIARDRIRGLTSGRKRGPKTQFGGKANA